MQALSLFDADLDFAAKRVRLWQPGTIADLAASEGLVEVPAAVLNESGGLGGGAMCRGSKVKEHHMTGHGTSHHVTARRTLQQYANLAFSC